MGIIKRADLESYTRDAVPMDLGDLHKRGQSVIEAAQEQAAQIIRSANEERERLISDASATGHDQGYNEGHSKGLQEGREQGVINTEESHAARLNELMTSWEQALSSWEDSRENLMISARTEVLELAAQIAARVIKRTIDLDPEVVVDQLEAVLETLVTPTDIRVHVHPEDVALISRVMPKMIEQCSSCTHAELKEDDTLAPGSCVVTTNGGGVVDASIKTQLDRVVATLLPAHRGPDYDQHLESDPRETSAQHKDQDTEDIHDDESKDDAA